MAENSKIAWTHATFNPWIGCQRVAPGCVNCYAEAYANRYGKAKWGPEGTRVKTSESYWRQPLKWNLEAGYAGERRRVFCASLADVFEDWGGPILDSKGHVIKFDGEAFYANTLPDGPDTATMSDVRGRLFAMIDATPNLDWLLLTKRPGNVLRMWPLTPGIPSTCVKDGEFVWERPTQLMFRPNVWLLTSVSEQASADKNIPELLKCRDLVPVLGISAEPLVGHFDLWPHLSSPDHGPGVEPCALDWVIVGGESGPNRRVCEVDDLTKVVRQCKDAFVPCFVKQDAAQHAGTQGRIPDDIWAVKEFPSPNGVTHAQ